ncbi:hypothetical protein [Pontibacter rugosus]|uniref:Uncharacterized protein n=1 Tax=Pontibacter rugosus TaxID=1745966 RepID=A0ABW3SJC3_9BACT
MMKAYYNSALAAITVVKGAELMNWIPEPESFAKAAILALVTGFLGGAGRWLWQWIFGRAKRKLKL